MFQKLKVALREQAYPGQPDPLVGVWELRSMRQGEQAVEEVLPRACIIFTPKGRFMALITGERATSFRAAAAFREAFAYSGAYRLDGGAWVTRRERSWNDVVTEGEQRHAFDLDGSRLGVTLEHRFFTFERMR